MTISSLYGFPVPSTFGDKTPAPVSSIESGTTIIWRTWAELAISAARRARLARLEREAAISCGDGPFGSSNQVELEASLTAITASAASLEAFHNFLNSFSHPDPKKTIIKPQQPNGKHSSKGLVVVATLNTFFCFPMIFKSGLIDYGYYL